MKKFLFFVFALTVALRPYDVYTQDLNNDSAIIVYSHHGLANTPPELQPEIEKIMPIVDAVFWNKGIQVQVPYINDKTEDFSSRELTRLCTERDVRWAVTVWTMYDNGRLSWRFGVFDAVENKVRASETFFTPLMVSASTVDGGSGVSMDNTVEISAERLLQKYDKSFPAMEFNGDFAVSVPQRFLCAQDGVEIHFGDENGASAGFIRDGQLTSETIFLFVKNTPVFGTATKKGYWSRGFVLPNGVTDEPFTIKPLLAKNRQSFTLTTEFRDIAVYSADIAYRLFIFPDRWFLKLGYGMWTASTALSSFKDKAHSELRFGTGLSLLPKNRWPLRFIAGTGASLVFSGTQYDILADPLWLGLEYHFSRWALTSEVRLPKIFWYGRDTFGKDRADFGMCISFGAMIKW
ncbi:MAG: hypothetical protein LBG05_03595 [Treponema sp.]|jgi:hypothetical protein|nr:hypothetical protein [Treponema sp.]